MTNGTNQNPPSLTSGQVIAIIEQATGTKIIGTTATYEVVKHSSGYIYDVYVYTGLKPDPNNPNHFILTGSIYRLDLYTGTLYIDYEGNRKWDKTIDIDRYIQNLINPQNISNINKTGEQLKDLENQITDTASQLKRTEQELEDASKKLGDLEARARKEASDFQRAVNEYNRLLNLAKSLGLISIGPGGSVRYPILENINALNERVRKEYEDVQRATEDFENYLKELQKSGKVAIIGGQIQILHPEVIHPLKAKQEILKKEFQEYETAREELERYLKDLESRGIIKISGNTIESPLLKQLAEQARIVEKERREALQATQEYESFYQKVYSPLYSQYQSLYNTFQDLLKQAQDLHNTYTTQVKNLETSLKVFEPYLKVKGDILANLPQQDMIYSLSVQWHHEVKEYEQTLKNLEQIGALQPGTASIITSNILQIANYVKNVHLANLKIENLFTELQKIKSPEFLADPFVTEYIKLTIGQVPTQALANLPETEIKRVAYALAETSEAYRRDLINQVKEMEAMNKQQALASLSVPLPLAINKDAIFDSLKSFEKWIQERRDALAQYIVSSTTPTETSRGDVIHGIMTLSKTSPENKVIHGVMTNRVKIEDFTHKILVEEKIEKYTKRFGEVLEEMGKSAIMAGGTTLAIAGVTGKIGFLSVGIVAVAAALSVPLSDLYDFFIKKPRVSEMEKVFRYTEVTTDMFGMPRRTILEKPKEELTLEEMDHLIKASKQTTLTEAITKTIATTATTLLLTWGLSKTIIEPLQVKKPLYKSYVITSDTQILGDVTITDNLAVIKGQLVKGEHLIAYVPQISKTEALLLYGWKTAKKLEETADLAITLGKVYAETTKISKDLYLTGIHFKGYLIMGGDVIPLSQDLIQYNQHLINKVTPFIKKTTIETTKLYFTESPYLESSRTVNYYDLLNYKKIPLNIKTTIQQSFEPGAKTIIDIKIYGQTKLKENLYFRILSQYDTQMRTTINLYGYKTASPYAPENFYVKYTITDSQMSPGKVSPFKAPKEALSISTEPKISKVTFYDIERLENYAVFNYERLPLSAGKAKTFGLAIQESKDDFLVMLHQKAKAIYGSPVYSETTLTADVKVVKDSLKDILKYYIPKTKFKPFNIQPQTQQDTPNIMQNVQTQTTPTPTTQPPKTPISLPKTTSYESLMALSKLLSSGNLPPIKSITFKPDISISRDVWTPLTVLSQIPKMLIDIGHKTATPVTSPQNIQIRTIEHLQIKTRTFLESSPLKNILKDLQITQDRSLDKIQIIQVIRPTAQSFMMETKIERIVLTKNEQIQKTEQIQITKQDLTINLPTLPGTQPIVPNITPPRIITPIPFKKSENSNNIRIPIHKYEKAKHERYIKGFINPKFFI
ncbi:MAG: hypothetical protein QXX30_03000 [Candidatus Aenigmatarchaeota archaeon]